MSYVILIVGGLCLFAFGAAGLGVHYLDGLALPPGMQWLAIASLGIGLSLVWLGRRAVPDSPRRRMSPWQAALVSCASCAWIPLLAMHSLGWSTWPSIVLGLILALLSYWSWRFPASRSA